MTATSNALSGALYRLVITVCLVLTSLGCTRTAEKFCGVDQETLKQNLIRLMESPVIKDGHCHVMGVAARSGDSWIKAINTDFEIK